MYMNNQHQTVVIHGVVRPGDISCEQRGSFHLHQQPGSGAEREGRDQRWGRASQQVGAADFEARGVLKPCDRNYGLAFSACKCSCSLPLWRARNREPRKVRLGDVTTVEGVRDNLLIGYGMVVGLHGTGDSQQTVFSVQTWPICCKRWEFNSCLGGGGEKRRRGFCHRHASAICPPGHAD